MIKTAKTVKKNQNLCWRLFALKLLLTYLLTIVNKGKVIHV